MRASASRATSNRAERDQPRQQPAGQHDAERRGGARQDEAFHEELACEAGPPGAQREADRDLAASGERAAEQQVGHVGARDGEHHTDGAEQEQQRRARVPGEQFDGGYRAQPRSLVRVRVLPGQPLLEAVQFGIHLGQRAAWCDPGHGPEIGGAAGLGELVPAHSVRECRHLQAGRRNPQLGVRSVVRRGGHHTPQEAVGHHARHGMDAGIEADPAPGDRGVPAEPPHPQAVREDDRPLLLSAAVEGAPEEGRDAHHLEEVGGHRGRQQALRPVALQKVDRDLGDAGDSRQAADAAAQVQKAAG